VRVQALQGFKSLHHRHGKGERPACAGRSSCGQPGRWSRPRGTRPSGSMLARRDDTVAPFGTAYTVAAFGTRLYRRAVPARRDGIVVAFRTCRDGIVVAFRARRDERAGRAAQRSASRAAMDILATAGTARFGVGPPGSSWITLRAKFFVDSPGGNRPLLEPSTAPSA
jgi:hypothetical protein